MQDNQAAPQGEGGLLADLRAAVKQVGDDPLPTTGGLLRGLGVDAAGMFRNDNVAITEGRRRELFDENIGRMSKEAGILSGPRYSEVDPAAVGIARLQQGVESVAGENIASGVAGFADSLWTLAKFPATLRNWVFHKVTGKDIPTAMQEAGAPAWLTYVANKGSTTSEALRDSTIENRGRTVPSYFSDTEAVAATGTQSQFAMGIGSAIADVGLAVASSAIPGGNVAAGAKAATTVGRLWAPVRAFIGSPGGRAYMGYMGGRSGLDSSDEYRAYYENEAKIASAWNEAIDRLGLPFDKQTPDQYSKWGDIGVSLSSAVVTATSEAIGTGFAVRGGQRVLSRLLGKSADDIARGGMGRMMSRGISEGALVGGAESVEEIYDVFGQALIRGVYNEREDGRFLVTGDPEDLVKTIKQYAPEMLEAAAISFIVTAPLGFAGGAASVRRSSAQARAFEHAFLKDMAARAEGGAPDAAASAIAARGVVDVLMAGGNSDVAPAIVEHLRRTSLPEIGNVTAEQLADPEWVAKFVRDNPLIAIRMAESFDTLSRTNIEWLTGSAASRVVPNADERKRFLDAVKSEVNKLTPAYMRGWADRARARIPQIRQELEAAHRGDTPADRARVMSLVSELDQIRSIQRMTEQAWVSGEMPSEAEFSEWIGLKQAIDAADIDGTADAEADSPATVAYEESMPQPVPREVSWSPASALRTLARGGNAEAAFRLSEMHRTGQGAEQHQAKAEYWFNVAMARAGDPEALLYLARWYDTRVRSKHGARKAWVLYRLAARQGSVDASLRLAEIAQQEGDTQAYERHVMRAGEDSRNAVRLAGLVLSRRAPASRVTPQLIANLEAAAEQGDYRAAQAVSRILEEGIGVEPDVERATSAVIAAATAPNATADAMDDLSDRLYRGVGIARDETESSAWFARASETRGRVTEAPQAAPAASVAQPAPATPQEAPAAPAASPAASEAPSVAPVAQQPESASVEADPAADTRRAVDARVAVEQRMQAEEQARADAERAEAERRAADEADAPRREVERQVQQGAEDPGLRVRFVEAATPVEEKIAKAAGKLGKRVQYIRIFRDEAREGDRRRRTPSGIRGFVGSDANTIYLVQVPNVMREQATTAYYLQTLAHENAHGVIRETDAETLRQVDALSSRALIAEFERRFDLGKGEERREEIRVQTLTLGVVDAAGLDAILLADTAVEKTIARLKLLFNGLKIALTGNERAALLKRLTQEQVARAKAAKEAKPTPTPAPAAAEPAATRAAKPKPAAKPTDDLARLIKDGQYVVGTTIQSGIPIEVVADGKTVVVDSTSQSKGIELRVMRKKLYLLSGSTASVVTSAKILDKPNVGKAKPKSAQATAEPAPKVDPANEPVASELPKPRRGRGKKGDGQQAMFMREIDPDIDTLPSIKVAGQSIREALLSTPKNHPYRDIAVAIAELPIPAMSEDRVGNERSKTDNFYSYDAAFEGQPRINLSMYTKYSTLIHEAVHAFTAESVKRSMLFALGRRDLAAAEGVDPSSLNGDAVSIARRLAKAKLIEPWELDGLLKERSEDERQSLLKMALLKRYVVDIKGDANIRTHDGYMAMVDAAIADPKTSVPVKRLLKLFRRTWAEIGEVGATATPNNRLMSPSGWDTIDTGNGQSEAEARRLRESLDIAYGLSNPLEFTAMAFSSPPFQRWLNERDGDGRKSLWERFVAIISRILGVKNDSMLESVIEASADLSDVRPDSVAFMRERTDTQLAADHRAAFERGDESAAREIVREYGRRKGYDIGPVFHGSGTDFNEFMSADELAEMRGEEYDGYDSDGGNLGRGFYFTPDRWYARHFGGVVRQFLLKISSPINATDPEVMSDLERLEEELAEEYGSVTPATVYNTAIDERGADGVIAKDAGGFSFGAVEYMVTSASQIKSADPFTYDSNGELIPLDKRFDESSNDIRFMREKPGSAFEMFRDDSPASTRTNRLATALFWKYTTLDRAVKAARRTLKIEPEDAANELFQLAPGISSRIMLDFGNAEVRPYEEAVKNLAKRLGMNKDKVMDLVQEHAFLKHALDVIAWLEKRDAVEIQRRADRAFTDLDAMGIEVSPDEIYEQVKDRMTALGLSKEQAQARLRELDKQFAADKAWSNLSDRLRAMNRKTLEIHRQAGNITEAAYQELVQRYPNYVPVVTSLFGDEVDQPTDSVKRPARRILRRMFRGRKVDQVANVDALRKFWAASWDLTKYDRMKAAHAASLVPADNAMFRLARQGALLMQGGDPLVEVVDMQALVKEQAMLERMRLRRERDAAEAKALEDGVELPPFKIDDAALMREAALKVANDIDMQIAGSANDAPSIRRFKLERDTDLTPQEVYEDIHHFMETGLTVKQAIANEEAAANGEKPKHTPLKPGTAAFDKRKDQLESRIRLMPKGTVMHYRINDPELAQAMLLNEPTMLEKMRSEGGLVARNFAKAWMKLMAFQRFAFVSASPGFWKGELFRSPQQAAIMARVMADELRLSPEQKDAFLRNLDAILVGNTPRGFKYPLIGVLGAGRALPYGKPWRSVRHVLKGNEPRNAYEQMVRKAIDDGVLQGGLYSVDSYETMVSRLKERIGKSMEGPPTLRQRGADKVGDVMSAISDSVDQITNGLDMVNRLNVYQAATMAGISRQQAAIMARESTVDFSKKGASIRGASQIYLFLSPRMQGIHQLLRAFSTGEGKTMAARTAASASKRILMRMFLWAFAWKMLREFFYEDDDEPQSVPSQFASLQNMLVPMFAWNDKKQHMYLEINNPYGFGAIAKLADRLGEFMVGDSTAVEMLVGAVGDFGSELTPLAFNLNKPSSLIQAITPTNLQVGTDLLLNQDWKGSPIYPEGAKFGPGEQRRSQQYFAANTWRTTIWLADMISDLTRPIYQTFGFEGQRGLEISPNQIQYVMQRWMPGLVRMAADGVSVVTTGKDARGNDVTLARIPFLVGSGLGVVTETGGRGVVAGQWRDMGTIRANMKVDLKEGRESRRQILERYGDVGRWFERGAYDNAERQIKKLQQARNVAMRAGKREIFDRINDRIEAIQTRVLREYARIRERSTGGGLDTMFQRGVLN